MAAFRGLSRGRVSQRFARLSENAKTENAQVANRMSTVRECRANPLSGRQQNHRIGKRRVGDACRGARHARHHGNGGQSSAVHAGLG